jgi:hypothetical protein
MKNSLYICERCVFQTQEEPGKPRKPCQECVKENGPYGPIGIMCEVAVASTNCFQETTVVPGIGKAKVLFSVEAIQDMQATAANIQHVHSSDPTEEEIELWNKISDRHAFGFIRTKDPSTTELEDWTHYHKLFSSFDLARFEQIKEQYKVQILREDVPYEDDWGDLY